MVPDAATCPACLQDMARPTHRRFNYAFTNCPTAAAFTLIRAMPYDRALTSMAQFRLCRPASGSITTRRPALSRQPIACPHCGPFVSATLHHGDVLAQDEAAVAQAAMAIQAGKIVAIKGLGGFHLACDATQQAAVLRLRQRKQRPTAAGCDAAEHQLAGAVERYPRARQTARGCNRQPHLLF